MGARKKRARIRKLQEALKKLLDAKKAKKLRDQRRAAERQFKKGSAERTKKGAYRRGHPPAPPPPPPPPPPAQPLQRQPELEQEQVHVLYDGSPLLRPVEDYTWQYQVRNDPVEWASMSPHYSRLHELHYRGYMSIEAERAVTGLTWNQGFLYDLVHKKGASSTRYLVSFASMSQVSYSSGRIRKIRRIGPVWFYDGQI